MKAAIVDDELFDGHVKPGHPESPARLLAARRGLSDAASVLGDLWEPRTLAQRECAPEELAAVHSEQYVERTLARIAHGEGHLDADTYFSAGTGRAALAAAAGVCDAATSVLHGEADVGVALVRPPGHHAEIDRAMGFCLFNNVAVAARKVLAAGARRVMILDWDAHHGNGTQHAFESDPRVLFVSLHQWPLYPGTGAEVEIGEADGLGHTINLTMPPGSGPADYRAAFEQIVEPVGTDAAPDVVIVSSGFDAHRWDPLTDLALDPETYAWMTRSASRIARGRVVVALEGGYDLEAVRESLASTVQALALPEGDAPLAQPPSAASPSTAVGEMLRRQRRRLAPFWPVLR
ncbi:MAG: histone deacetylase [Deltaproteobacteria bacterium]|nr:histone deacetylase [Deltaproteobacteria bacterium]